MLKYLFQATYNDGTIYQQTPEDVSRTDPKKSCYYDVDQEKLKVFFLYNDEHTYSVNLQDGHFEVDNVPFFFHEENNLKDFKLIFFRQHTHSFIVNQEKNSEISHMIVYRMGWQCTVNGKNYQKVMQIN